MNAQNLINSVNANRGDELLSIFYPTLFAQKKADENLTKCLRGLN